MSGFRDEVRALLQRAGRQRSMDEWRANMHRTARDADASVNITDTDIDSFIESLGKRARESWEIVAIFERDEMPGDIVRKNAQRWTALHERWVAGNGPAEHVARLRWLANGCEWQLEHASPPFSDESTNEWIGDIASKRARADRIESEYAINNGEQYGE